MQISIRENRGCLLQDAEYELPLDHRKLVDARTEGEKTFSILITETHAGIISPLMHSQTHNF